MLTGRIVDSYTNILTVKLFARARDEDAYVREAVDQHTRSVPQLAAAEHAVQLHASSSLNALLIDRHRRARDRALDARRGRGRRRWRWRCR